MASISDSPFPGCATVTALRCFAKSIQNDYGCTNSISQDILVNMETAIRKDTKMRIALIVWHFDGSPTPKDEAKMTEALHTIGRQQGEGLRRIIWDRSKHSKEDSDYMTFEEFTSTLVNDW